MARISYKKVTQDLGHHYDFINCKPVIQETDSFYIPFKKPEPWERIKNEATKVSKPKIKLLPKVNIKAHKDILDDALDNKAETHRPIKPAGNIQT